MRSTCRRDFLRLSTGLAAGSCFCGSGLLAFPSDQTKEIPRRVFGRTELSVSILGLGGWHIGTQKDPAESIRIIQAAIDAGINFLDNSWDYGHGASEIRVGKALKDGYRQRAFVMTKFDSRNRQGALRQIEESLRRLDVDTIDLVQVHEVIRPEDADHHRQPCNAQQQAALRSPMHGEQQRVEPAQRIDANLGQQPAQDGRDRSPRRVIGRRQPEEERKDRSLDAKGAQEEQGGNGRIGSRPRGRQLPGQVGHVQGAREAVEQPGPQQEERRGELADRQVLDCPLDLPALAAEGHEPKGRDQHDLKEHIQVEHIASEERPVQPHQEDQVQGI
ncbi:MAG: aldo/keto reductase [Anaerolineae bacterium]|nr:aldo/keto reductase [Anaerolineae bacterium]